MTKNPSPRILIAAFVVAACLAGARAQQVTWPSLVRELVDLDRLTRWPEVGYRTVQFSSTDRRTRAPDQPGWFANADGFGQEPIPNFAAVLRQPGDDGLGEYLLCDVSGPGAIVRGWSAGMDGVLRVYLDGAEAPLFEGRGYDFLARRSSHLVPGFAALPRDVRGLLQQQDADYLPIPFAERLRVTWTGSIAQLHFYELQVRRYDAGAAVRTFASAENLAAVLTANLVDPWIEGAPGLGSGRRDLGGRATLAAGESWQTEVTTSGGAVLRWLRVRLAGTPAVVAAAWRSTLLRITFDGASVPQVEAPLGDFSGAGPWLPPHRSVAFRAGDDALECVWPMPYGASCRIELHNHGAHPVEVFVQHRHGDRPFDERTMHFHARWRVDHELFARAGEAPIDLPYLGAVGRGRLVGLACQIVNPPMAPDWRGNWWGEGDEKIFVDGELSTLGTGSEDYFNYSWSHWRYFSHPFCGQPLTTGPGNCGYVSNHRFQIVDDLPFERSLQVAMELWSHKPVTPLSYARTAWFYASPGVVVDHRAIQPGELRTPALQPWPADAFAARGRTVVWPLRSDPGVTVSAGELVRDVPCRLSRSRTILGWTAPAGAELRVPLQIAADGDYGLRVCFRQRSDAPAVQLRLAGAPLKEGEVDTFPMTCVHGERLEDLVFPRVPLLAGDHELVIVCPDGGEVGIDLVGHELRSAPARQIPGAVEAELWPLLARSEGLDVELQRLNGDYSAAHHRWVKARRVGDFVTFRLAAPQPGRHRVVVRLTRSWDFGVLRVDWNGAIAAADVDLWSGEGGGLGVRELDLGERDLSTPAELRFEVVGHAAGNRAPHYYFGIDCAVLTPAK